MSAELPQDRKSVPDAARNEDGTFTTGRGSPNPGGQPKEIKKFRELLKGLLPQSVSVARKVLNRAENTEDLEAIIADGATSPEARLEAENALNARLKLGAQMNAEIWKYSVPKPTTRVKMSGQVANPLAGVSNEALEAYLRGEKEEK